MFFVRIFMMFFKCIESRPCTSKFLEAARTESNAEQSPSFSSSELTSPFFNFAAMRAAKMAERSAEWTTVEFTLLLVRATRPSWSQDSWVPIQ